MSQQAHSPERLRLWYRQPATQWNQALQLGNGRMGAMVFGGVLTEQIALTETTCWAGEASREHNQPDAASLIPKIRHALFAGDYETAERLAHGIIGRELNYDTNLEVGNLLVHFPEADVSCQEYIRDLYLDTALASVAY